ncbi:MAG TPA: hypothetical protein VJ723_05065, partial [Candidatus Angelobacter sp.]|nr:hypothetical protein [Candidatus Angelobacter sp.]
MKRSSAALWLVSLKFDPIEKLANWEPPRGSFVLLSSERRYTQFCSMYCRRYITVTVLFIFLFAVSLHAGDQKKQQQIFVKADQKADLQPARMVTARQKCENWALAAGLETLFDREGVSLDQNYWVTRLSRAEVCRQEPPDLATVADAVNQDFVQPDGRHVRLQINVVSGPPTNADAMIAGIKLQRLSLLLWRGHAYYLTGVTYDEHA